MKKAKKILLGLVCAISIPACASQMNSHSNVSNDNTFGILSTNDNQFKHFDMIHNRFQSFIGDLNLTNEQKEGFKAIKETMKSNFENHQSKFKGTKEAVKKAFLGNSRADLKNTLEKITPDYDEHINNISTNILKAYNLLNDEQKSKIEKKVDDMESKINMFIGKADKNPFFNAHKNRFESLKKELNLSTEQEEKLKNLITEGSPDRVKMFELAKKIKTDLRAELKSGTASADRIKEILSTAKDTIEAQKSIRHEKILKVYDTLNVEQRTKLVNNLEKCRMSFLEKIKSHFHK